jgi:hypothetical protein
MWYLKGWFKSHCDTGMLLAGHSSLLDGIEIGIVVFV